MSTSVDEGIPAYQENPEDAASRKILAATALQRLKNEGNGGVELPPGEEGQPLSSFSPLEQ